MTEPLRVLWEAPEDDTALAAPRRSLGWPQSLVDFYGGALSIPLHRDRPTIVANFVSTLDGVVSFAEPGASGGSAISGSFGPDRRLMGLLRSMADAVLMGAGTVRKARREEWTARDIDPALAREHADARRRLSLAAQPTTVVVTASGKVDLGQPGLSRPDVPVLILTTPRGRSVLPADAASERLQIVSTSGGNPVAATGERVPTAGADMHTAGESMPTAGEDVPTAGIVSELAALGASLVLCEGGPHLLGRLLADGAIDELFLTLAPQVAGRADDRRRLALIEDRAFSTREAPWGSLLSVRQAGSHLFLRYRFDATPSTPVAGRAA